MKKVAIIVGAGEMNAQGALRCVAEMRKHANRCCNIAADGGLDFFVEQEIEPDYIIGDFDSLSARAEKAWKERNWSEKTIQLMPEKDDTDLLAAIRLGLEQGCDVFYLFGVLGGRIDHTIANLQCLAFLKKKGCAGFLFGDTEVITVICEERLLFAASEQGTISVFCYGERAEGVSIRGLKYELEDAVMSYDYPIGVSNEFCGKQASVAVKKGMLLLVFPQSCIPLP